MCECGKPIPQNAKGHHETIVALQVTGVRDAIDAARLIGDLQSVRIKADYHLDKDSYFTEVNAKLNLEDAHSALSAL
jgi:hypothetical protein